MKKQGLIKITAIILAFCLVFSTNFAISANTQSNQLASTRDELEEKLNELNKKLDKLGSESKETEEYLSVLDEKITYLRKQYDIAVNEASSIEAKVQALEKQIVKNEEQIDEIRIEVSDLELQVKELNIAFQDVYTAYCERLRAMYISGSTTSIVSLFIESTGIADLLIRLEMVSTVTNRDVALMKSFKEKSTEIVNKTNELKKKNEELSEGQKELSESKRALTTHKAELVQKQSELEIKQKAIEEQQKEANELLKELHKKSEKYGEFRDITQKEIDEIDKAIEAADKKYEQMLATSTTKATTKATTKPTTTTTTRPSSTADNSATTTTKPTTTKPTTTTTTQSSSKYINMVNPCPNYPTITCAFGAYRGHTGCDFSTRGNVNQPILAVDSGIVIISTDLTNADGSYRSYGRYIVIRHDKTTKKGETVYTLYAHNNSRLVSEGQYVSRGQQIAKSGSTGNSTGPHLHFEVRVGGSKQSNAVDPEIYLP